MFRRKTMFDYFAEINNKDNKQDEILNEDEFDDLQDAADASGNGDPDAHSSEESNDNAATDADDNNNDTEDAANNDNDENNNDDEDVSDDDFDLDTSVDDNEDNTDAGSDDQASQNNSNGGTEEEEKPVEANTDIFSSLSNEEQQIKIRELKSMYNDLYNAIDDTIEKINQTETSEQSLQSITKLTSVLTSTKQYMMDYMVYSFPYKSYIENDINFNRFLAIINSVTELLKTTNKIEK